MADSEAGEHRGVKKLIWVYFWLLILEGALRKWIFPQWATPLMIIRDPVVMVIYVLALGGGIFPRNLFIIWTALLFFASAFVAIFVEEPNLWITLFGLRCNFLHLPLIFIIPAVFTIRDVEKVGKWLLIIAIPMSLLVLLQFRSSPSAWVNVGVGAAVGAQMEVGFGKIRPPGTFSFTNGLGAYLSLVASFIMAWQLKQGGVNPRLVLAAIPATGVMMGVSGSRGVLTAFALILAGVVYVCIRRPMFFGKGVRTALLIGVAFFALQFKREFRQGMFIHETRLTTGGGVQFGLVERVLGGFLEPFSGIRELPIFGHGIGRGTTAAGGILTGDRAFLLAEGEWMRVVSESGALLGFAYLGMRVAIVILLGWQALRALHEENPLPAILFCAVFPTVLSGQFGVPTMLGFAAFGAGLCLAAARVPKATEESELFRISPESATNPNRTVRGRSIYAERLHGR